MSRFTRKSAPRLPKLEWGGFSEFGQCPYLDCFFKEMASLTRDTVHRTAPATPVHMTRIIPIPGPDGGDPGRPRPSRGGAAADGDAAERGAGAGGGRGHGGGHPAGLHESTQFRLLRKSIVAGQERYPVHGDERRQRYSSSEREQRSSD